MKIIHIADLHIQSARRTEYLDVFDNLMAAVEKHQPGAVVIAGDIFDNKITVRPDEIEAFCYLAKCIMDLKIHLVMIPGNHDCNMNDAKVSDLLSPIVQECFTDNDKYSSYIHFWPATGVYTALDIDWYVYSPIDRKKPNQVPSGRTRIALVHETVKMCSLPNGIEWSEDTRLSVDELAEYDITMIGDIHKMQFLRPHVAYSGSLVQQNIGESHDDHGYILWDTKTCRGQFYPVENPTGVMIKLHFENNKINEEYRHVKRVKRCDVTYRACTADYIEKIRAYVRDRWNINATRCREVSPEVQRPIASDQDENTDILETWLAEQKFTDDQKMRIRNCDTRFSKDINYSVGRAFTLVYMEWRNMLCYTDTLSWIDFRSFRMSDRVGIIGANRSGKSSILDVMAFVLYNMPIRGLVKDVRNKDSKNYMCRAVIAVGADEYEIRRTGDNNDHNRVVVTHNGRVVTKSTIPKTYQWFEAIIGRFQDFTNITCQLQDQVMFTSLPHKEQTRYIYNILGLDRIPDLITRVKQERLALKGEEARLAKPRGKCPEEKPDDTIPECVDTEIELVNRKIGNTVYGEVPECTSDDTVEALQRELAPLHAYPAVEGVVEDITGLSEHAPDTARMAELRSKITDTPVQHQHIPDLLPVEDLPDMTYDGDIEDRLTQIATYAGRNDLDAMDRELAALPPPVEGNIEALTRSLRPVVKYPEADYTGGDAATIEMDISRMPPVVDIDATRAQLSILPPPVQGDIVELTRQIVPVSKVVEAPACHQMGDTVDGLSDQLAAIPNIVVDQDRISAIQAQLSRMPHPICGDVVALTKQLVPTQAVVEVPACHAAGDTVSNLTYMLAQVQPRPVDTKRIAAIQRELAALPPPIRGDITQLSRQLVPIPHAVEVILVHTATDTIEDLVQQIESIHAAPVDSKRIAQIRSQLTTLPPPVMGDRVALAQKLTAEVESDPVPLIHDATDTEEGLQKQLVRGDDYEPAEVDVADINPDAECKIRDIEIELASLKVKDGTGFQFVDDCAACTHNRLRTSEAKIAKERKALNAQINNLRSGLEYSNYLKALDRYHAKKLIKDKLASLRYKKYTDAVATNVTVRVQMDAAKAHELTVELNNLTEAQSTYSAAIDRRSDLQTRLASVRWAARISAMQNNTRVENQIAAARAYDLTAELDQLNTDRVEYDKDVAIRADLIARLASVQWSEYQTAVQYNEQMETRIAAAHAFELNCELDRLRSANTVQIENTAKRAALQAAIAGLRWLDYTSAIRHNAQISERINAARAYDMTVSLENSTRRTRLEAQLAGIRYRTYLTDLEHNQSVNQAINAARAHIITLQREYYILRCARNARYKEHNRMVARMTREHTAWKLSSELARHLQTEKDYTKVQRVRSARKFMLQKRLERATAAYMYNKYKDQVQYTERLAALKQAVVWRAHAKYNREMDAIHGRRADLDLYLIALDMDKGYPAKLIKQSITKMRNIVQDTVGLVVPDKVSISDDFQISMCDVPIQLGSGFQKMVVNLAVRYAMLQLAQVGHQKMTLYIDEGLLGSCDSAHMHLLIKSLLPALRTRLFMISHHDELKAAMTRTIRVNRLVQHGDQLTEEVSDDDEPEDKAAPVTFECDVCDVTFKSQGLLSRHLRSQKHKNKL